MKTELPPDFLSTPAGERANAILRNCVHCGFCNATCPTYQLTGDELDGPRGRIYQIKQLLEGKSSGTTVRLHLDRCLTCRNCESTCPSGVRYGRLLDIGREAAAQASKRPFAETAARRALHRFLLTRPLFDAAALTGRLFRRLLPGHLRRQLAPLSQSGPAWPGATHARKVILHEGCVQPALQPAIDRMTAVVLDRLGIQCIRMPRSCCGAISHHLDMHDDALETIRRNIDLWWPLIETQLVEGILSTATGCGVTLRDYATLLEDDPDYREKAAAVGALVIDPAELIAGTAFSARSPSRLRIAYHPPCTQQHGQQIRGQVQPILRKAGHEVVAFNDEHLCCGSAGTYSILQPGFSGRLRDNKLENIGRAQPDMIATANIGCMMQLQSGTEIPVVHWIELLFNADMAK